MKGFTLIELLISITIIMVMSGAVLVTFLSYRDRRTVNDDANALANRLRSVQSKATATEVPAGCGTSSVTSYVVTYTKNTSVMTVAVNCGAVVPVPELTLTLPNSTFGTNGSITFDSRSVSASGNDPTVIDICGSANKFTVSVFKSANIGKPVYAGSC